MFTKSGIIELHSTMHKRLNLLLHHVTTVPEALQHKPISGFGQPSIWKQLVHILTCEEGWVHHLQNIESLLKRPINAIRGRNELKSKFVL
jgi:uncharacterized damage-inducible protein DinB